MLEGFGYTGTIIHIFSSYRQLVKFDSDILKVVNVAKLDGISQVYGGGLAEVPHWGQLLSARYYRQFPITFGTCS